MVKKKVQELSPLSETLLPAALSEESLVLELDELWSFVYRKSNKVWVWIVLCRNTRQVVAYAVGDRSEITCRCLWDRVPESFKIGTCYTDFWDAYAAVIDEDHHCPVGKSSGQTNHIERWNNTLRQHLGRFVRKTLSFSKSLDMHEICLQLFLHRYNLELLPKGI